ncbi:TonB-dependent receptor [Xanthomonas sp. Kuri4-1]
MATDCAWELHGASAGSEQSRCTTPRSRQAVLRPAGRAQRVIDAIDGEHRELGVLALGLDYRGERARMALDLGYQDHHIDAPRPSVTPSGALPDAPDARRSFAQPWTYTDERDVFGVARAEYDLSDTVMAWGAVGVRDGEESNVLANPTADGAGHLTVYRFDNRREDRVVTGEAGLRAAFATGRVGHRVSVSASVYRLDSKNAYAMGGFGTAVGTLTAPRAVAPIATTLFGGELSDPLTTIRTRTRSLALADTLAFADERVMLTLGARQQTLEQYSYAYATGAQTDRYDADALTPVGAVVFKLGRQWSIYANYAEALQPGQVVPATSGGVPLSNVGEVLDPFTSRQYELGAKYDSGRVGATAALFRIAQPNTVVADGRMSTDGEQRNQGLELSGYGEVAEGLRVLGGFTLMEATLQRTQGGVNAGNDALGVPRHQANLGLEWDWHAVPGLTTEARAVHTGRQYADAANSRELPAWTRMDLGVRYGFAAGGRHWSLRARVDNVFDLDYWASTGGASGANYLVLGAPRTYTVSLSVDL